MAAASAARPRFRPRPVELSRERILPLGERPLLMAVVNVTPDSFYDGSRMPRPEQAVERALALVAEGADIIDIGGESTRPGAAPVAEAEEIERVLPVVEAVRKASRVAISVDTRRAEVARLALGAGADIVNDVSGLLADPAMAGVVAAAGAIAVVMHMRGTPETMAREARYDDVILEVKSEIGLRLAAAARAGIAANRVWIDPGIGFAKTARHSLEVLGRLEEFLVFEKALVVGASRKSFLGRVLAAPDPGGRLEASLAAAVIAALKGAHVLRVHDVAATRRAVLVADAVMHPERFGDPP